MCVGRAAARDPTGQGRVIARDLVLMRIPPAQDAGQAGRAETARHVASTKYQALAGQPIESRRADLAMPHEAIVACAHVVGDDEHDVGGRCRIARQCGKRPAPARPQQPDRDE